MAIKSKRSVSDEEIKMVKKLLKKEGLSAVARRTGISYYFVWKIANGKYDSDQSPRVKKMKDPFSRCPITGW